MRLHFPSLRAAALAAMAAFCAAPGAAQQEAARDVPVLATFSGGISLGSYQAGATWALLEVYRQALRSDTFRTRFGVARPAFGAVTGASAGNINALLWAVEACTMYDGPAPPEESLFWQMWIPVGMDSLMPPADGRQVEMGLFDRGFMKAIQQTVERRLGDPKLKPDCVIPIGITLTRLRPDHLPLEGLPVRTQRVAVPLVARVKAVKEAGAEPAQPAKGSDVPGHRMVFEAPGAKLFRSGALGVARVPRTQPDQTISPEELFEVVKASSAFPLAFQPLPLTLQRVSGGELRPNPAPEVFLDGGVFDNNPMDLALLLHQSVGEKEKEGSAAAGGRPLLVHIDPDFLRGAMEKARARPEQAPAPGGVRSVLQLLAGAVPSAREYELQALARNPNRLSFEPFLPKRGTPVAGDYLGAFGAFLSRGFREYDFYVGAYEALRAVADSAPPAAGEACAGQHPVMCLAHELALPPAALDLFVALLRAESAPGEPLQGVLVDQSQDWTRAQVYRALLDAQRTQLALGDGAPCRVQPLPGTILCGSGMDRMLAALAASEHLEPYRERVCGRGPVPGDTARQVLDEMEICPLLGDQGEYMKGRFEQILHRLVLLEDAVDQELRQRAAADTSARDRRKPGSVRGTVEGLSFIYYSTALRPRRDWGGSSLPDTASWLWNLIPHYVSGNLGSAGAEIGYRPAFYLDDVWSVEFPLIPYHWSKPPDANRGNLATCDTPDSGPLCHWGAGVKLVLRPRSTGASMLLTSVGAGVVGFQPYAETFPLRALHENVLWTFELSPTLLADRIRLDLRYAGASNRLQGRGRISAAIGLNDTAGLVYWISRIF